MAVVLYLSKHPNFRPPGIYDYLEFRQTLVERALEAHRPVLKEHLRGIDLNLAGFDRDRLVEALNGLEIIRKEACISDLPWLEKLLLSVHHGKASHT